VAAAVSPNPTDNDSMTVDVPDPAINLHLTEMMQGIEDEAEGSKDLKSCSPLSNKQKKKASKPLPSSKTTNAPTKKAHTIIDTHAHKFPRTIVNGVIELKDANPFQEFIAALQNLLKNGQLVDPHFAFCPIKVNGGDKKIHEQSGIPVNMTMLGANFKILSGNGKNPFDKQKVWGKGANKNKDEYKNPVVWFTLAIATDVEPEDLVSRIVHKWHRIGGVCLMIKDLQSFKSKTVLSCFNVFTQTNKSVLLAELEDILTQAQVRAQEIDPTEFRWSADETPKNSSLPPIELRLQNPKLPGQDTSHYSKLSWRAQANKKVLHVECDKKFTSDIKHLMHYAKECGLVEEFWGRHAHISKVVDKGSSPSKNQEAHQGGPASHKLPVLDDVGRYQRHCISQWYGGSQG
jgi:hypothetical protein